jgi:type IV secretory pathway VirB4 component
VGVREPLWWSFDHATDDLTLRRFQVFSFKALGLYPELLEPVLFYVLSRVAAGLAPSA